MRSGEGPGSDHAFFYGRICPQHGKRRGRRRRCDLFAPFDAAGQVRDGDLEITGNLGVSVAWTSSTELLTCHQSGRWEDPTAGQVMFTLMKRQIGARTGPLSTPGRHRTIALCRAAFTDCD
ncbi:uncharacterized [Lates japonicus]